MTFIISEISAKCAIIFLTCVSLLSLCLPFFKPLLWHICVCTYICQQYEYIDWLASVLHVMTFTSKRLLQILFMWIFPRKTWATRDLWFYGLPSHQLKIMQMTDPLEDFLPWYKVRKDNIVSIIGQSSNFQWQIRLMQSSLPLKGNALLN